MENEILREIINYATKRLNEKYGYCGVAESPTMAMLNSDDGEGHDIKIHIKIENE